MAQCVEFYYTYKKQVKIGRNGVLTFGPPDSPVEKQAEAVLDIKVERWPSLTVVVLWLRYQRHNVSSSAEFPAAEAAGGQRQGRHSGEDAGEQPAAGQGGPVTTSP